MGNHPPVCVCGQDRSTLVVFDKQAATVYDVKTGEERHKIDIDKPQTTKDIYVDATGAIVAGKLYLYLAIIMSPPCRESQGYQFDPTVLYLLSCSSP